MKILLVSELHSSNLGDGLIAICVVRALEKLGHEVSTLDLSARSALSSPQTEFRVSRFSRLKRVLPNWVRRLKQRVSWHLFLKRRCAVMYRRSLEGCGMVLIGGGQLLADNNLDFPRKLNLLHKEMKSRAVHYSFLACGVGSFSARGSSLVLPSLQGACDITVRDQSSVRKLHRAFPSLDRRPSIVLDPAVTVRELLSIDVPKDKESRPRFGLGIIAKQKVDQFQPEVARMSQHDYDQFWLACATQFSKSGDVVLISNGEPIDSRYAKALQTKLADSGASVDVGIFQTPTELAGAIGCCSAFIGARLHALICAVIQGVPTMAVEWDSKVAGVMQEIGCKIPVTKVDAPLSDSVANWINQSGPSDVACLSDERVATLVDQFTGQLQDVVDQSAAGVSNAVD